MLQQIAGDDAFYRKLGGQDSLTASSQALMQPDNEALLILGPFDHIQLNAFPREYGDSPLFREYPRRRLGRKVQLVGRLDGSPFRQAPSVGEQGIRKPVNTHIRLCIRFLRAL